MSANKAYKQWGRQQPLLNIRHETNCYFYNKNSLVPINECNCTCYEKAIFRAGYFAARGMEE